MVYNLILNLYWATEHHKGKEGLITFVLSMPLITWSSMILMSYIGDFYVIQEPWLIINGPLAFAVLNWVNSVLIDWQSSGWVGLYYCLLWIASNCFYRTVVYAWIPALVIFVGSWLMMLYPIIDDIDSVQEEALRILFNGPQLVILTVMMFRGYRDDLMDGYKNYGQLVTGIMSDSYPRVV